MPARDARKQQALPRRVLAGQEVLTVGLAGHATDSLPGARIARPDAKLVKLNAT
jgi:hypothetical protein